MWFGWLVGNEKDRELLQELGVKIVSEIPSGKGLDCQVEVEDLDKLDPYWGQFYWGLEQVKE